MKRKYNLILIAFILFFYACRKKECRKKEDTVSGDALEIVLAQNGKDFIYPDIPDSLYLKQYNKTDNKYPCAYPNIVILNQNELDIVNGILINHNVKIPDIDFNKFSYYIFINTNIENYAKVNLHFTVNNNDSISNILEITEHSNALLILGKKSTSFDRFILIKTNKINFRKYEKVLNCKYCN